MSRDPVSKFYKDVPFNLIEDIAYYKQSVIEQNQILEYKDLHSLLNRRSFLNLKPKIKSVIEFGCGTGWLTNSISYYYRKNVRAIDFTEKAVNIAAKISKEIKVKPSYYVSDIFDYQDKNKYDLVISLGVLHHTVDTRKAFNYISRFVKPGGYLYVGLYHYYGRRPMLNLLKGHLRWNGIDTAYNLFKRMNKSMINEEQCYSWFRDQVLHPREDQHTFSEVSTWFEDLGFNIVSTSINNYQTLSRVPRHKLVSLEKKLENLSYEKNVKEFIFNPGYFTVCAKNNLENL